MGRERDLYSKTAATALAPRCCDGVCCIPLSRQLPPGQAWLLRCLPPLQTFDWLDLAIVPKTEASPVRHQGILPPAHHRLGNNLMRDGEV